MISVKYGDYFVSKVHKLDFDQIRFLGVCTRTFTWQYKDHYVIYFKYYQI